jgi:hypothetical protein
LSPQGAAARIKAFAPAAKIINQLREPVTMMKSLHAQYLRTADEDVRSFADVIGLEAARRRGLAIPRTTLFPRCMAYIDVATLAPQIERYLALFGSDAVKVILLDDLERDTRAVYLDTLAFLGLPAGDLPDLEPHNVSTDDDRVPFELRAFLREVVREDVATVEALIGRDLSAWKTP